jgi:hypothetical protein
MQSNKLLNKQARPGTQTGITENHKNLIKKHTDGQLNARRERKASLTRKAPKNLNVGQSKKTIGKQTREPKKDTQRHTVK